MKPTRPPASACRVACALRCVPLASVDLGAFGGFKVDRVCFTVYGFRSFRFPGLGFEMVLGRYG